MGGVPPKPDDRPERQEDILRASQERPRMRGISRIFGVSRNTLADWIKKKSRRGPRSGRRFQPWRRMMGWKSRTPGVSFENGFPHGGSGPSWCDGPVTSSPLSLALTVNGPVDACGAGFRWPFVSARATATAGRRRRRYFRKLPLAAWATRRAPPLIGNAGTRRFVNGWDALGEKPCRVPNELVGMIGSPPGSLSCII